MCAQAPGIVSCYAGDGNQDGLTFIHGWNDENGTPAVPVVRDVSVLNVNCEDALRSLLPPDRRLRSRLPGGAPLRDAAGIRPGDEPRSFSTRRDAGTTAARWTTTAREQGSARRSGQGSAQGSPMTSSDGRRSRSRSRPSSRSVPNISGRSPVSPTHTSPSRRTCRAIRRRPAQAPGRSSTSKLSTLDVVPDANSRNTGDPPLASVIVTVGLRPPFQIQSPLEPPVVLRVASPSGSQNQAFDCDTTFNFQTEIENGCSTTYRENYGDWDNDGRHGVVRHPVRGLPERKRTATRHVRTVTAPGLRPCRDRRQDRPVPARHQPAAEDAELRAQQLAGESLRLPGLLHRPRLRERSTLRHAGRDRLRNVSRSWKQLSRSRSSTSRASMSQAGTRRATTCLVPTTSPIPGIRPGIDEVSTTETSGATSSTS